MGFVYPMIRASWIWFIWIVLCAPGCTKTDSKEGYPWSVATQAFSKLMADKQDTPEFFTPKANGEIQFLRTIKESRYRFLGIEEFIVSAPEKRSGLAGVSIDGWPMSVKFTMAVIDGRWRVNRITNLHEQRRIVGLLGPGGLPAAAGARWPGGLSGRDSQGRPNAAILLLLSNDKVSIDGGDPIPMTSKGIIAKLKAAFKARKILSASAYATYRPHAALAVSEKEPATTTATLLHLASEAGATSIQLLVRSEDGPGWLPMARFVNEVDPYGKGPLLATLSRGKLLLAQADAPKTVLFSGSTDGGTPLIGGLKGLKLSKRSMGGGIVIRVDKSIGHARMARNLAGLYKAFPDLSVTVEHLP